MTTHATARLVAYAALAAGAVMAAAAFARPELVSVAVPFSVVLVAGLTAPAPVISVSFRTSAARTVEGEVVDVEVRLRSSRPVQAEVTLAVPDGMEVVAGSAASVAAVEAGRPTVVSARMRCNHWGVFRPERAAVRITDRPAVLAWRARYGTQKTLEVHPATERLRRLLHPAEMQPFTGTHVARARGDGIEFADIRPFVAGDRARSVNWRATARRGDLWVNDRHPERNTDVVLFLDTFADVGPPGAGTLDRAVRAAAALAQRHLAAADRVGLVGFGGVVRSVPAGMGVAQLRGIASALLTSAVVFTWADKTLEVLPPRSLPPRSLVVALTPLADPRSVATLADVRARGFDVAIVECAPGEPVVDGTPPDSTAGLARRIWDLEREAVRAAFRSSGVPLVTWREGQPLDSALEQLDRLRRAPRPVR